MTGVGSGIPVLLGRGERQSQEVVRMVRMVRVLANALGASVIAEGVETAGQRDRLLDLGCTQGQGFYYGRAMAPETFARSFAANARLPAPAINDHEQYR